jgi:hypothetical protein
MRISSKVGKKYLSKTKNSRNVPVQAMRLSIWEIRAVFLRQCKKYIKDTLLVIVRM